MGYVHVSFQCLAYGLVHDDCSLEALCELTEGYAAEIRPLRDRAESSRHMDKSSLEESSPFRRRYRHLVHLNLGETANHLHNIISVHPTYGLEDNSVGILLDSDANACLVGQQVSDEPGQGPVDERSQVGVDDDEVVPLFDRKQVIIWDREALFVLLVCLRYGTFKRLRVRRIFFAQRLSYFRDLFPCFVQVSYFPSDLAYLAGDLVRYWDLLSHPAWDGACRVGDWLDEYLVPSDTLHHPRRSPDNELRTWLAILSHERFIENPDSTVRLLLDHE